MSIRFLLVVALAMVAVANALCTTNPTSLIIAPPQLVTTITNTHLTTDLKITYSAPSGQLFKTLDVAFKTPGGTYGSYCDVGFVTAHLTGASGTTFGNDNVWSVAPTTVPTTSCDTTVIGLWATTGPFHQALTNCFAYDNTTDQNYNFFTANVRLTTTQDRPAIRGVPVVRTVVAYTRFQFKLQRVITIATTPTVSGSNLASADVVSVQYGEITPTLGNTNVITVYFLTSTPNPYQLSPWTSATGGYGAGLSALPSGIGASLQLANPFILELTSYPGGLTGPTLACVNTDPYCTQLWQTSFIYTGVGNSGTCSPSATLRFSYRVNCQSGLTGCVSPTNAAAYDLYTTLSATNLCSQLIQTTSITPTIALYKTDADAAAGTNPTSTFNLGETIYSVTSLTSSNGPNLAGATLVSFKLQSAITIDPITVLNPRGVQGLVTKLYAPSGNTIRAGLAFDANTNALQFADLNSNQGVVITITWTAVYDIPLDNKQLVLQGEHMALMDTPNSEDLSVTTAFVLTTETSAPAAASTSNTMAIAIGAAGGFLVVALLAALIVYHRHVKKMLAAKEGSKVQIFVPMASSSNVATAPTDVTTQA